MNPELQPDTDQELVLRSKALVDHVLDSVPPKAIEPPDPEKLDRMERALLALPRITREIFLANRIDGYSYAKIATITGLSVRQVKRQMVKALIHLGRWMRGDERTAWQRFWQSLLARPDR